MPCNPDIGHPTNSNFNLSEFITNSYVHFIEVGLEKLASRFSVISLLMDIVPSSDINVRSPIKCQIQFCSL